MRPSDCTAFAMDELSKMQFIDLSDIEEPERNSILASLQRSNPSVQGPWKIKKATPKAYVPQPSIPPEPQPTTIDTTQVNGLTEAIATDDAAISTSALVEEEPPQLPPEPPVKVAGKSWASLLKAPQTAAAQNGVSNGRVNVVEARSNGVKSAPVQNGGIPKPRDPEFDDPNYYRLAEYLSNHAIEHKVVNVQPRGLVNRSNYCYINSILQALLACPPFYNLMLGLSKCANLNEKKKHMNVITNMAKFITEFKPLPPSAALNRTQKQQLQQQGQSHANGQQQQQNTTPLACDMAFEPKWMYRALNGVRNDTFQVEGRQEDAEEFLGCLLNGLNDEMLELIKLVKSTTGPPVHNSTEAETWKVVDSKNKGTITRRTELSQTPISDIFGGQLRSRVHRSGDQTTDNIQPFFTLQLHIEKAASVREALEQLVAKNSLEGVISARTNREVEAWQQVTIEELPIVLILHLKYFDYRLDGCTKILKQIEFPLELKIETKLLSSKSLHASPTERQYQLFAVVYHDGHESSKGHYVTDTFHQGYGTWLRCDDATLRPIHLQAVLQPFGSRVPYLLFYRRMDSVATKPM